MIRLGKFPSLLFYFYYKNSDNLDEGVKRYSIVIGQSGISESVRHIPFENGKTCIVCGANSSSIIHTYIEYALTSNSVIELYRNETSIVNFTLVFELIANELYITNKGNYGNAISCIVFWIFFDEKLKIKLILPITTIKFYNSSYTQNDYKITFKQNITLFGLAYIGEKNGEQVYGGVCIPFVKNNEYNEPLMYQIINTGANASNRLIGDVYFFAGYDPNSQTEYAYTYAIDRSNWSTSTMPPCIKVVGF